MMQISVGLSKGILGRIRTVRLQIGVEDGDGVKMKNVLNHAITSKI